MHVMRLLQNSSCNIFHWKIKIGFLVRILSPSFYNGTYEYPPVYWLFSFSFLHVKMTIRSWIDVSFFSQWILISSIFVSHTYIHPHSVESNNHLRIFFSLSFSSSSTSTTPTWMVNLWTSCYYWMLLLEMFYRKS